MRVVAATALTLLPTAASADRITTYAVPALELTDAERDWLAVHPVIRLGIDNAWAPLEFVDEHGNYAGMAADYLGLVADDNHINRQLLKHLPGKYGHQVDFATNGIEVVTNLIGQLPDLAAETPRNIQHAPETGDLTTARDQAHRLNGSAGTIRAGQIADLESAIDEQDQTLDGAATMASAPEIAINELREWHQARAVRRSA